MMAITDPAHYFYLYNGGVLKDLNDLLNAMRNIDSETFIHHVNNENNDFFNWARDILKDSILANRIKVSNSPEDIIKAIEKRMATISNLKHKKESKKSRINQIKEAYNDD